LAIHKPIINLSIQTVSESASQSVSQSVCQSVILIVSAWSVAVLTDGHGQERAAAHARQDQRPFNAFKQTPR